MEELKERAEVPLGDPCWVKAEGSDMKAVGTGQSSRALAVLVRPGSNVGPWHTLSISDTQDPSIKARYILIAPRGADLGQEFSRKPTLTTFLTG